ncbi:MAG: hypothetical protein SV760_00780 [Halobacteria archaeon]|nr:hypothetical protein [Halobacteria archaeon]
MVDRRNRDPEAFGYYTEVRKIEPTYGHPPAYSGMNAREELDDVPPGGEVALTDFDVAVKLKSNDRDSNSKTFVISYRVDYDAREVVAKTVTEKFGARSGDSDAPIATLPLAAAVARGDAAARSFLDREGLEFDLRSLAELVVDADDEANDVLVSDVETIVDAQERAEAER